MTRARAFKVGIRLVGPLLLALVLYRSNPRALWRLLAGARVAPLVLACALNAAVIHLKVVRTQLLCRLRGFSYGTKDAWRGILPSLYLGMVTPGRVGDVLRVPYLRRDAAMPYAEGLAVVVMDRLCDLYVLLAFVAAGAAHFARVLRGPALHGAFIGALLVALAPLALLIRGPADAALGWLARLVPAADGAGGAARFLTALRGQLVARLWPALPLTAGAFLLNYVQGLLAARALGLSLGLFDVIFVMAVASLLGLLPISVSGVGVREGFMQLVFPALGFRPEAGVAFGLLVFVVIYLSCSLAGFFAWQWSVPALAAGEHKE